jgi:drug/metabolite transporter (DMT)-like permease
MNRNLKGAAALCLGILVFSIQDGIIKLISGSYAVTEAVFIRSVVALPILLVLVMAEGGLARLRTPNAWPLTLRGFIMLIAYTAYYLAFPALPLASAIALFFVAPLIVTALAGPMLGERVSIKAIFAVILGFAGVLVMTRPGSGVFEPAALLSLLAAACYAFAMVYARKLGVQEPASVISAYQNWTYLGGAVVAAGAFRVFGIEDAKHPSLDFLVRPWTVPPLLDFGLMAICGVAAAIAIFLLTYAYRTAEARRVTVFEYSGLIWGALWGFLCFDEIPSLYTIAGAAMIFAAGLLALARDR